jgi:hypothetical protein
MESSKMLTILVLGLVVCTANVCEAAPMGTVFTYQGRLIDANSTADGPYDFVFGLFDGPVGPGELGAQTIHNLDVIDGYFTVELDFGSNVFDGSERWLQIEIRPGELDDPNEYTTLGPRQELTPTPYALYAETTANDNDWMVSGDDMYSIPTGNVGIGNPGPTKKLSIYHAYSSTNTVEDMLEIQRASTGVVGSGIGVGLIFRNEVDNGAMALSGRIASVMENPTIAGGTTAGMLFETRASGGYMTDALYLDPDGNVGIGTANPETKLHLYTGAGGGSNPSPSNDPLAIETGGNAYINIITPTDGWGGIMFSDNVRNRGIVSYDHEFDKMYFYTAASTRAVIDSSGNVGVGTTTPGEKLHVVGNMKVVDSGGNDAVVLQPDGLGSAGRISMYDTDGTETVRLVAAESSSSGAELLLRDVDGTSTVEIDGDYLGGGYIALRNSTTGATTITLDAEYSGDGRITTQELQITGGSDLSEQFDIDGVKDAVKPGMLVSIDPKRPGKLLISNAAYDNKVAGVISGAGGVKPGMMMGQKGSVADGIYPVALTGRVYCWADASTGAIQPGDLLTTSSVPGHAMKVSEHTRALGAIIGKAMTSLEKDKGLVLVLVSLQ